MGDSMDQNQSIKSERTTINHQNNTETSSQFVSANTSPSSRSDETNVAGSAPSAASTDSEDIPEGERLDNDALAKTLSSRRSHASGHEGAEWAQIERLISRMFGHERKANSEEEQTRHLGVIWKNLTVKGQGLGAVLQPTNGNIFLCLPRRIKSLLTRGRKDAGAGKPEIRTILGDFTVCNTRNIKLKMYVGSDSQSRDACIQGRCFWF
jgi:hypothetical protein